MTITRGQLELMRTKAAIWRWACNVRGYALLRSLNRQELIEAILALEAEREQAPA